MNCPKCRAKMTLLFTSAVCDVCDPPLVAGVASKPKASAEKAPVLWIYHVGDVKAFFNAKTRGLVYPRQTRDEAYRESPHMRDSRGQYHRVYYNGASRLECIYAARACPTEEEAMGYAPHNNAVWLLEG